MWDKLIVLASIAVAIIIWKLCQKEHSKFKFHFKFFTFYIYASICCFLLLPVALLKPKSVDNARYGSWAVKHFTKILGIEWVLRRGEILAEERGAVIVGNHQSSLDMLGQFNIWHVPYKMAIVTKKELFYIWPYGLYVYLSGSPFVDRSKPKDSYKQIEITTNMMVNEKTKLFFFAEGTRNKESTDMLPFKKGAFIAAVSAQVPILPIVYSPYYFINKEKYIFDKGQIIIQCLDPIETKGLTLEDIPELIEQVRHKMMATYRELTREVLDKLPSNHPFTTKG